jgi:predicted RNase H-like nuclease (RuvC/YqgF family)
MDKNNQIIIAGFLAVALISGAALFFYSESQKEIKIIDSLKPQIDSVAADRIDIVKNMEILKAGRERLVSQLKDYGEKIKSYEAEIPKFKAERENIAFQLIELEKESSDLTEHLNEVLSRESELNDEIANAQSSRQDLLNALEFARAEKTELEEKLKLYIQKAKGVQLPKIVVKVAKPAEGNIIEVSKKFNFFVADLGEADGVKSGDILEVYRDSKFIAKALIENVYDDMSSIVVFDQWQDVDILVGDTVKLQIS